MPAYFLEHALLPDGWAASVRVEVEAGWIHGIEADATAEPSDEWLQGIVIPGMPNLHSHAFQRAMAGRAERGGADDFWSWRHAMYDLAARMTPEELQAIAAHLYAQMLEAGYTAVAEFHYLHAADERDGPQRMSSALVEAAAQAGIGLTLLPVLYQRAGFDDGALTPAQARFALDTARYVELLETLAKRNDGQMASGIAFHSLRAVAGPAMRDVLTQPGQPDAPVHIHVAEQQREVDECRERLGARPVEWLLANQPADPRWCLVHATHITPAELDDILRSGATVALCPSTEANLGDGFFRFTDYQGRGGRWGIGSDSQVCISPAEELRWLEYGARLQKQRRCVAATEQAPHTGAQLYRCALAGGAAALGRSVGAIAPGHRADFVALDAREPLLAGSKGDAWLDCQVFVAPPQAVREVVCGGRRLVRDGRHEHRDALARAARAASRRLYAD